MRVYHGIKPETLPPPDAPDFQARTRSMLTDIDYFLRDASFGFARIIQGQTPDGTGNPIPTSPPLTDYFYLPGRTGNQVGHGGTTAGGYLAFSSTSNTTKGKIYLGDALTQGAFDETTGYLGIGTISPAVLLHLSQTAALTYARPNNETPPGVGGWRDEAGGSSAIYSHMNEVVADDSLYIQQQQGGSTYSFTCPDTTTTNYTAITLNFRARKNTATANNLNITLSRSGNTVLSAKNVGALSIGPGFTAGSYTLSAAELLDFNTGATGGSISLSFDFGGAIPDTCAVSWFEIQFTIVSAGEMTRWSQSDGTVLLGVDASGDIFGGGAAASTNILSNNVANSTTARIQVTSTPDVIFDIPTGTVDPLTVSLGLVSGTMTGMSLSAVFNSTGGNSSTIRINNTSGATTANLLTIDKVASQSGRMTRWRDVSPTFTELSYIDVDGSFNGPIVSSSSSFVDSGFRVIGSGDATKKLAFEVDTNIATATTRTVTAQNVSGTMALLESAQTFTRGQTVNPTADEVAVSLTPTAGALAHTLSVFDDTGVEVFAVRNDPGAALPDVYCRSLRIDANGFAGGTSATISTANITTASRTFSFPDATGQFLIRVGAVTVAPRTTNTSGTLVAVGLNPSASTWMVNGYGNCTVAGTGNVQVNILFTDNVGAKTYVATTISMTATTNSAPFSLAVRTAAGTAITYSTTVTTTGTYSLVLRASQL